MDKTVEQLTGLLYIYHSPTVGSTTDPSPGQLRCEGKISTEVGI